MLQQRVQVVFPLSIICTNVDSLTAEAVSNKHLYSIYYSSSCYAFAGQTMQVRLCRRIKEYCASYFTRISQSFNTVLFSRRHCRVALGLDWDPTDWSESSGGNLPTAHKSAKTKPDVGGRKERFTYKDFIKNTQVGNAVMWLFITRDQILERSAERPCSPLCSTNLSHWWGRGCASTYGSGSSTSFFFLSNWSFDIILKSHRTEWRKNKMTVRDRKEATSKKWRHFSIHP